MYTNDLNPLYGDCNVILFEGKSELKTNTRNTILMFKLHFLKMLGKPVETF